MGSMRTLLTDRRRDRLIDKVMDETDYIGPQSGSKNQQLEFCFKIIYDMTSFDPPPNQAKNGMWLKMLIKMLPKGSR